MKIHRAIAVLLLLVASSTPRARADFAYVFALDGQAATPVQNQVFQVGSGGNLALDVFLVEYNVTSTTSRLLNDGGLFSAGVRVNFGGGARTASVSSLAGIVGTPAFDDPTSLNTDLNKTGTVSGGVPAYSAGLNEAVDTTSVTATAGTYNGGRTYSVLLGVFNFSASSAAGDINTITSITATRFDASTRPVDYTVTDAGTVLDSITNAGTASIKILPAQAVPEPTSIVLGLLGIGSCIAGNRARRARKST